MTKMQHVITLMAVSCVPATLDILVMEKVVLVSSLNDFRNTTVICSMYISSWYAFPWSNITSHVYLSTDIDECVTGMDSCSESADCMDTEGSYGCMCNAGYSGDGFSCESEPYLDSFKKNLFVNILRNDSKSAAIQCT